MIIRISSQNPNAAAALARFCAEIANGNLIESAPPDDKTTLSTFYRRYYMANAVARDVMFKRNPAEYELDTLTHVIESFWKTFIDGQSVGSPTTIDVKYLDMKADAVEEDVPRGRTFYIFPNAIEGFRVLRF